jgi:hypothetical protein
VATTRARLAEQGDTRPFTHSHFFRYGEKVEGQEKDLLAIVQTQARPPHYVVQVHNIYYINIDTRPFTHSHFFRYGEKVEGQEKDLLAIVQTQARPSHYVVQVW